MFIAGGGLMEGLQYYSKEEFWSCFFVKWCKKNHNYENHGSSRYILKVATGGLLKSDFEM